MSPSVLQLQSVGVQNLYLSENPEVNLFKYKYYRYVNFATEVVKLPLNEIANFNKKTVCDIPRKGHLLSKLHLHLRLPALVKTSGTYLSWADTLAYSIFSSPIELEIGGVIIDRLYPRFMDMWDELTNNMQLGKYLMLLKSDNITSTKHNAEKIVDLMIPLDFWFTRQYSSALPILCMHSQNVRINFKFNDFLDVVNYDGDPPLPVNILDSNIYAEYVYLDDIILDEFQTQKHVFVIEQMQYNGDEIIPANNSIYNSVIKFNNPVKEIVFACASKENVDNNNYFAYSILDQQPIISEAALLLDGKQRFEYFPEIYYRANLPQQVHSVVPFKHIYCMPFSINPQDNQPTGSITFSNFNDVILSLRLSLHNPESYLYIYALSYNILTIDNGILTLVYAT